MATPLRALAPAQPGQQGYSYAPGQKERSGIGNFFLGKQQQWNQIPTQTPQGMYSLQQALQGATEGLQNPYAGFEPIAQQAQNKFQKNTLPGLKEMFTSFGGSGTGASSDFGGTLSSASSDFDLGLAALKSQYGMQNRSGLLDQLRLGLTPQFETVNEAGGGGFFPGLLQMLMGGAQSSANQFGKQFGMSAGNKAFGQQQGGNQDFIAQFMQLLGA